MGNLPQLKVRTEFSFPRRVYGPIDRVVARLVELGAPVAGIVNAGGGTWGHARFEAEMVSAGLEPLFGAEFVVPCGENKPVAWVLGVSPSALYRFASAAPSTTSAFAAAVGVLRFAGAALDDPEAFDYIDVSPRSPVSQRRALNLARLTGKPLVLTSENLCPAPADLELMLALVDRTSIGVQWLADEAELRAAMPLLTDEEFAAAVRGAHEVAERLKGQRIPKAPLIHVEGDLRALCLEGKARRVSLGHIPDWTPEYEQRMERELAMIATKKFESYFLVVADLVRWAKTQMLVGPARGSSAGSLVCYLTGITEVDPLIHQLLFERFVDINRNDLPDIDIDFSDTKRDMVFDYLAQKYGREHVARLGNINTLKPTSVLMQLGKKMGVPLGDIFSVKNVLLEYSSGDARFGKGLEDTLTNTTMGRRFAEKYPNVIKLTGIEGHATHTGVHAAGVIVCNEPITNFCTVNAEGIAQIDKPDAEYLQMLKIDALGLRTLGIIEDAGCVTADELYALKLDDPEVLNVFNERKFAGIFQFEGASQRSVSNQLNFDSFKRLDHATALARPGPLGGGAANSYIRRAAGIEPVVMRHPSMELYLGETMGVVLYQEQVMRIGREIGGMSWEAASTLRVIMSRRKGQETFNQLRAIFMEGAEKNGLTQESAAAIWHEIHTFGAWGMNKSHTVSYAIISYWCGWMKRYHPLEFAAATLRSAKDDNQAVDILRELHREGIQYTPVDLDLSESNWSVKQGTLIGGLQNIVGFGPAKAAAFIEARESGALTEAHRDKVLNLDIKFADLFPMHTAYGDWYEDPQSKGIASGWRISQLADLEDDKEAVVLCRLIEKEQRDENEEVRAKKRNGRLLKGNTLFADLMMVDDSVSAPVIVRVDRFQWFELGVQIMAKSVEDEDVFLVRGKKLAGYPMMKVYRIKCLTQPDMFDATP